MFKRPSGVYYLHKSGTYEQFSLKTKDEEAAEKLLKAYNE